MSGETHRREVGNAALTGVGLMPNDTTEEVNPVKDQTLSLEKG